MAAGIAATCSFARADFVDALPELAATPTAAPSLAPVSKTPGVRSSEKPNTGAKGAAQKKKSGQNAGTAAGTDSRPAEDQGEQIQPSSSESATSGSGSGLFGSDVTKHNANAPIRTKGDTLEGSLAKGKMTLTGNVEIQQADTIMRSEVAEVFSKPGTTTPERAVAKGKVSIKKSPSPTVPEIRAVADELEYFVATRRVVLKGKPKIWRGQELLQGEVIEAELDTGEIKVRGARGVVDPKSQQGGGNPFKTKPEKKR